MPSLEEPGTGFLASLGAHHFLLQTRGIELPSELPGQAQHSSTMIGARLTAGQALDFVSDCSNPPATKRVLGSVHQQVSWAAGPGAGRETHTSWPALALEAARLLHSRKRGPGRFTCRRLQVMYAPFTHPRLETSCARRRPGEAQALETIGSPPSWSGPDRDWTTRKGVHCAHTTCRRLQVSRAQARFLECTSRATPTVKTGNAARRSPRPESLIRCVFVTGLTPGG
jgi:hypothetical protein